MVALLDTFPPPASQPAQRADWWARKLSAQLDAGKAERETLRDYYEGKNNTLKLASDRFVEVFGEQFASFSDNWMALVVDAVEERLKVEGFRFGEDLPADDEAWRIWQTSQLDSDSGIAHTDALVYGRGYVLVQPGDVEGDDPVVTVESADEAIVATRAGRRRERLAAMKRWTDDDGRTLATVYLPDGVFRLQRRGVGMGPTGFVVVSRDPVLEWIPREGLEDGSWALSNPTGRVPMVPFVNKPTATGEGCSEIKPLLWVQDAVSKLATDMMVAAEFAAFRQRTISGLEMDNDPVTGEPKQPFKAGADRLWITENPDAKFGEFSATDLTNYVAAIDMLVNHIASQSRTPPHYFAIGGEQWPSGDAIRSAEAGLASKCRKRTVWFGESWEEVLRLAFALMGQEERASVAASEAMWKDVEVRTESQHIDGLVKLGTLGIPNEMLWERAGFSPTDIKKIKELRQQEALEALTLGGDFGALVNADLTQSAPPPAEPEPIVPANS